MNLRRPIALIAVITLALWFTGCSGGSGSPPDPPAISVVLNPQPPSSMDAGKTTSLAAAVSNDTSNAGVKWSVSCGSSQCGSFSPASTASGATAVTFNPAPPASLSSSASASLIAVVSNHNANAGVKWTVACGSAQCGSFNLASTPSGTATNYTAPAAIPTPATVTVTAASVTDTTKSASASITITAPPPVLADGNYVYHLGRGRRHRVILCYRRVYRPERRH